MHVCAPKCVCVSASSPVLLFLQFIQLIPSIAITMCAPNENTGSLVCVGLLDGVQLSIVVGYCSFAITFAYK